MAQAILHLSEEFISEDLDYYFSGERDKNNQIRPDDNIFSMLPSSSYLSFELDDDRLGNFFFPTLPNFYDQIYIGVSIPLFANNWGASFLLQLLKILKPDGAIILPVYPEGQAQEKGYWSRSFLENIFLSRQRWTGFSNVRAENDGVMSLSVGRKWPEPIVSTIEWFYQQQANILLEYLLDLSQNKEIQITYTHLVNQVWQNYTSSAIVEKIILEQFGAKAPVTVQNFTDDFGLLITDLLLSPYINITKGVTYKIKDEDSQVSNNFNSYFMPHTSENHIIVIHDEDNIALDAKSDVVCVFNATKFKTKKAVANLFAAAWEQTNINGLLIIYENLSDQNSIYNVEEITEMLECYGPVQTYSSIVASKIENNIDVSHYSTIQESWLAKEKQERKNVFRVINKTN